MLGFKIVWATLSSKSPVGNAPQVGMRSIGSQDHCKIVETAQV